MKYFNVYLLFYLNKAKINQKGTTPIMVRITVAGERYQFASGLRIEPKKWLNGKKITKDKVANQSLDSRKTELLQIAGSLRVQGKLNIAEFRKVLRPIPEEATYIQDIIKKYSVVAIKKNADSLRFFKNLSLFFSEQKIKYITEITEHKINLLMEWLTEVKGVRNLEYKVKHWNYLSLAINHAKKQRIIKENPLDFLDKPKFKRKPKKFTLTKKQVNQLKTKEIQSESLSKVRDLFLFQ